MPCPHSTIGKKSTGLSSLSLSLSESLLARKPHQMPCPHSTIGKKSTDLLNKHHSTDQKINITTYTGLVVLELLRGFEAIESIIITVAYFGLLSS
ncbi:hypothetical protein C1H46_011106 [Malus baccata]|uniref:Uncharacterized protein n=1 Tax=Malus baccata TaxID=106549 RepID=A0A540MWX6_MALBA|nr:hypothetical protein C1H46_011106 [Malus baccata]